ncbi:hypothetical protein CEUSTIGMA_g8436.t1 [Chlamydomonas eustigma]|uniref:Uncharacterized protein n=1 Tax=Chlamydomonas eustigma TaxID=1157962 RepID=A0A250XD50_9CHLO|nr:hypothetical protein CEUSTIGMA_g8436.t1 [Chlamydomonas eustigma]|eukprot:GAX81001.1 hypothetical protein CEUSTIGMA_g8436.t1 [Chlamydomonas eustigma]
MCNVLPDGSAFWWTLEEAAHKYTRQVSPSGCGPTAAIDVLRILGLELGKGEVINLAPARVRNYDAPLVEYLISRAKAGTTHADLIQAVHQLSSGTVSGLLFSPHHLTPPHLIGTYLSKWMAAGAVPVLTMNLFLQGNDAWHHQVVYGVRAPGHQLDSTAPGMGAACSDTRHRPDNPSIDASAAASKASGWHLELLNPLRSEPVEAVLQTLSTPPFMVIPRDHIQRKLMDEIRVLTRQPAGIHHADVASDKGYINPVKVEAAVKLCMRLQEERPWSDFAVGNQLMGVLSEVIHQEETRTKQWQESFIQEEEGTDNRPVEDGLSAQNTSNHNTGYEDPIGPGNHGNINKRSSNKINRQGYSSFADVVIPWGGVGGITLFAKAGSKAHDWLVMKQGMQIRPDSSMTSSVPHHDIARCADGQNADMFGSNAPASTSEADRWGGGVSTMIAESSMSTPPASDALTVFLPLYNDLKVQVFTDLSVPI